MDRGPPFQGKFGWSWKIVLIVNVVTMRMAIMHLMGGVCANFDVAIRQFLMLVGSVLICRVADRSDRLESAGMSPAG